MLANVGLSNKLHIQKCVAGATQNVAAVDGGSVMNTAQISHNEQEIYYL